MAKVDAPNTCSESLPDIYDTYSYIQTMSALIIVQIKPQSQQAGLMVRYLATSGVESCVCCNTQFAYTMYTFYSKVFNRYGV